MLFRSTVSRALNNHPDINPETKKMILKTVEESNFVPNNSARNLKRTDSKSIAILVKEIDNPFFATMMRVMEKKIRRQKYSFFIQDYASRLGADCAFFIRNAPTYAEGIGNVFSPISLSLKGYQLWLVKPDIFVSTRDAFSQIKPHRPERPLKETIQLPVEEWRNCMVNDFEESVFPQFPAIREIKEEMYRQGAVYASMSGSGSSVYGIFKPNASLPDIDFGKEAFVYKGKLVV